MSDPTIREALTLRLQCDVCGHVLVIGVEQQKVILSTLRTAASTHVAECSGCHKMQWSLGRGPSRRAEVSA